MRFAGLLFAPILCAAPGASGVEFPRGVPAHVVYAPDSDLQRRVLARLTDYLEEVLGQPCAIVPDLKQAPPGKPVILLFDAPGALPLSLEISRESPEAFGLMTGSLEGRPVVMAAGNSLGGMKQAIHRLIVKSRQEKATLTIPELNLAESPWIPRREWTVCSWTAEWPRGAFVNPFADRRMNIWLYGREQLERYAAMFDSFGFNGVQLLETCSSYATMGSPEAYQARERTIAEAVRRLGGQTTLWVWAAQFNEFGWDDPTVVYKPREGLSAFDDPQVRASFEKYYDLYAELAPDFDRLIAHFYDPGNLRENSDVFAYTKLLEAKFKAKNPAIKMGIDSWSRPPEYLKALAENGFKDYLLLETSIPIFFKKPGQREELHRAAREQGLELGVWGWYDAEMESDQLPSLFVNAKVLKSLYRDLKNGAFKIQPVTYWSEMEAHHLNNIYSLYAASQLLWNPDRDPDEILAEISEGVWGPVNGPKVLAALHLIQDTRSGDRWETYWWNTRENIIGVGDAAEQLRRANDAIAELEAMKTDDAFVPKFPLPFPPAVFVELMLPHLRQIAQFAQFRLDIDAIREAARNGDSQDRLTEMLVAAWQPIPDYNTWIGMFGQLELRKQEVMVHEIEEELGIEAPTPEWLRQQEADRLLQNMKIVQRGLREPRSFKPGELPYFWPPYKSEDRFQKLIDDGSLEAGENDGFRLSNWEAFARR